MMKMLTALLATVGLALALSTTANARDSFNIGFNVGGYNLGGNAYRHHYNNHHRGHRAPVIRYRAPRASTTIIYGNSFGYYAPPVVRYVPRVTYRYFNNGNSHSQRRNYFHGQQRRHHVDRHPSSRLQGDRSSRRNGDRSRDNRRGQRR